MKSYNWHKTYRVRTIHRNFLRRIGRGLKFCLPPRLSTFCLVNSILNSILVCYARLDRANRLPLFTILVGCAVRLPFPVGIGSDAVLCLSAQSREPGKRTLNLARHGLWFVAIQLDGLRRRWRPVCRGLLHFASIGETRWALFKFLAPPYSFARFLFFSCLGLSSCVPLLIYQHKCRECQRYFVGVAQGPENTGNRAYTSGPLSAGDACEKVDSCRARV